MVGGTAILTEELTQTEARYILCAIVYEGHYGY